MALNDRSATSVFLMVIGYFALALTSFFGGCQVLHVYVEAQNIFLCADLRVYEGNVVGRIGKGRELQLSRIAPGFHSVRALLVYTKRANH